MMSAATAEKTHANECVDVRIDCIELLTSRRKPGDLAAFQHERVAQQHNCFDTT